MCLLCKRKKGKQNKKEQENENVNTVESPRSKKLSVDIDNIPHQRSPLWVNGPQGIAPIETKYNGDHRISKSPVLDKQYNPFSVFPFGKGKKSKQEDTQNGHELTVFQLDGNDNIKEYPLSKEKNIPNDTNLSDSQKLKTITMANNQKSERLSIEDLENNKVIPTRPDNYAMPVLRAETSDKDSSQIFQTGSNGNTSRNSNVTPKAIVLQTDDNAIYPSHTQLSSHTPKVNCEKQSKEAKICRTKIDLNDSEVATLSQRPYKQQSLGLSTANQVREYQLPLFW
ncbi:uncharacterized protein LOC132758209 [Ruditapes philippinarum]|uniref:uncharacterized protein LOC132758209 n=1 Tax=Ruditapes philippinarum TaxID=129788 RepID=UPI00295B6D01|nr:uncharacterized protein LOC132758209 [Ruditapes philippinarum]